MRRADVCLDVVDSNEGLSEQDVKICGYVHEQGKPSVIVMNKWDLIEKDSDTINKFNKKLYCDLAFMDYYKSVYVSAKSGQRVEKILAVAMESYENARRRITTGTLNDLIGDAVRTIDPPSKKGRRLKIMYITQASTKPPTFVLFVNDKELAHYSYVRYIENQIRSSFGLEGTPIRFIIRQRGEDKGTK